MKWMFAIVIALLAALIGATVYIRAADPRPAGEAMGRALTAAVESFKATGPSADFAPRARAYLALARSAARAELEHGSDVDLVAYAGRMASRPGPAGANPPDAAAVGSLHEKLLAELDRGLANGGAPDQRFLRIALPVERALAELGRLADGDRPESALRSSDPGTLLAASAAAALERWSDGIGHAH